MVMRLNKEITVEDLRKGHASDVAPLRRSLLEGACVQPDPRRADFYEVSSDGEVYYIHISPVTGHVLLLASWSVPTTTFCD